eukprot:PLAT3916.1.p1 GENE.PLAT3916.1~~PLAT3916.1.p1  ORF type:complete len:472 (+),score=186.82 PLAT3916.1:1-1416(+)
MDAATLKAAGNELLSSGDASGAVEKYIEALTAAGDGRWQHAEEALPDLGERPTLDEAAEAVALSSLLNLSLAAVKAGKQPLAVRAGDAAIQLRPTHAKAHYRRSCARLAAVLLDSADVEGALQDARTAYKAATSKADRRMLRKHVKSVRSRLSDMRTEERLARAAEAALVESELPEAASPSPARLSGEFVKRSPLPSHFPDALADYTYRGSDDGLDFNLLIMLQGFGGLHYPFFQLARKMALPQTATLAFSAPMQLPVDAGRGWFPLLDASGLPIAAADGERRRSDGLKAAREQVIALLETLVAQRGWSWQRIHLFGYAQGGSVALDVSCHCTGERRLGSVVSVSGVLLPELHDYYRPLAEKVLAPTLLLLREEDAACREGAVPTADIICQADETQADLHWRPGTGMPASEEDMWPIMKHFAEFLYQSTELERSADVIALSSDVATVSRIEELPDDDEDAAGAKGGEESKE